MKLSRHSARLLILLGLGLFLGFLFWDFILANVVTPIALILLLFWRVILSVHQAFYWGAVVVLAVGLAFYRLFQGIELEDRPAASTPNSVLKDIGFWRLSLQLASEGGSSGTSLKSDLRSMLVELYVAKQPDASHLAILDALRCRQLPLPDSLYRFLFVDEGQASQLSWRERLQRLAARPGGWIRHWTGHDKADYYRALEEALTFMETLMEIKNGNDYFDPSKH